MKIKDELRQKELEALGLKVIRFSTKEITNELESVLQTIEKQLEYSCTKVSPSGGGGGLG